MLGKRQNACQPEANDRANGAINTYYNTQIDIAFINNLFGKEKYISYVFSGSAIVHVRVYHVVELV